jgi:hypothetical protein
MNLAGSTQVGLGKKLLGEHEWWKFEPVENGASWLEGKAADNYTVPYAFGDEKVRIVYVPEARTVVVRELDVEKTYSRLYFDPVSGLKAQIKPIRPVRVSGRMGVIRIERPQLDHDWVVVLQRAE